MIMLRMIIIVMSVLITPVLQRRREDRRDQPEKGRGNEEE